MTKDRKLSELAVNFCCPYQCKWLLGGPSPKLPIICLVGR